MPRNISFSMTMPQYVDGSKDVTRRFGWWNLKPGDILNAVEKAMGLKPGEKIKRLGQIRIVSVRAERLDEMVRDISYGKTELKREGYPFGIHEPQEFVDLLAKHYKVKPDALVNRIEFERIES